MPLYIRRPTTPAIVEAEQMSQGAHAHPQGTRPARPGDWVVTNHSTGQTEVLTAEEFAQQYEPAPVPQHLLAPAPGTESSQNYTAGWRPAEDSGGYRGEVRYPSTPTADQPVPGESAGQTGDVEAFSPSGPTTPMNEGLPGRPAPTVEVRPRTDEPGPIETPTGLVEQPGDADKEFKESTDQSPPPPPAPENAGEQSPPPPPTE